MTPAIDAKPSFRIRRSQITTNGVSSGVDPAVQSALAELDELLGKAIFPKGNGDADRDGQLKNGHAKNGHEKNGQAQNGHGKRGRAGAQRRSAASIVDPITRFFGLELTPKHVPAHDNEDTAWEDGSLAAYLAKNSKGATTLSEEIDKNAELAQLKYAFLDRIRESFNAIPFNGRAVLEHCPNVTDYLIAYAFHRRGIRDEDALRNFILNTRSGTRTFSDYAAVSAARALIDREQLKVYAYNSDDGQFVRRLTARGLPLSVLSYQKAVRSDIREFIFDRDEESVIRHAKIFKTLPADLLPELVRFLQRSPLVLTRENVDIYLPGIVLHVLKQKPAPGPGSEPETSEEDFSVQFEDDADTTTEVDRSSVLCAAQLYHGMVLGEELDVFGAVHYLAHRRMNMLGGMRIDDQQLREDLQRYVFDNQYLDLRGRRKGQPSREKFRTRPAERQMFHRQVFDEGAAEMPEDMLVNAEFKRLWRVLMLEAARYLERAQASLHPDSFVSRQNVMQAVEDLQYNLSTHCTGMATVISPAVDAELAFVLERILKHPEILRQVVPEGGTWKRAMDRLNSERRRSWAPATTLYNKATIGKKIIEMIADYDAASFEEDETFSEFIGNVDAFITTQSILQRPLRALREAPADGAAEGGLEAEDEASMEYPPGQANAGSGTAPADEWDF